MLINLFTLFMILIINYEVNSFINCPCLVIKKRYLKMDSSSNDDDIKITNEKRSSGLVSIVSPNYAKVEEVASIYDIIRPSYIDGQGISSIIAGQGIILIVALVKILVFVIDVLRGIGSFDSFYDVYRLKEAIILSVSLLGGLWIFDKIPMAMIQRANRENKFALLNLFGLNSSPLVIFAVTTFLCGVNAFGEEVFFRGFLLPIVSNYLTVPVDIAVSSIAFGFLHFPRGVNSLGQMGLGAVYSAAYLFSGSLVVPIVAHTLFDFGSTLFPLYLARREVKQRIEKENERWKALKNKNLSIDDRIDATARILFDLLDINSDGSIDSAEIELALKEFGFGPSFLINKQLKNSRGTSYDYWNKLFVSSKSRPVTFNEFKNIVREQYAGTPTMFTKKFNQASWDEWE